jgi:hypothetical protein
MRERHGRKQKITGANYEEGFFNKGFLTSE